MRLSQNKHFLSVHVRLWTLSRSRRVTWRERPGGAWKRTLCTRTRAGYASQMSHGDCHCVPSYNFIEADLRSIVRPVDSRRGVVVCVRASVRRGAVRASTVIVTYLQMALGYDELSSLECPSMPDATQRPRKLRPDIPLRSFLHFMHVRRSHAKIFTRCCRAKACDQVATGRCLHCE